MSPPPRRCRIPEHDRESIPHHRALLAWPPPSLGAAAAAYFTLAAGHPRDAELAAAWAGGAVLLTRYALRRRPRVSQLLALTFALALLPILAETALHPLEAAKAFREGYNAAAKDGCALGARR